MAAVLLLLGYFIGSAVGSIFRYYSIQSHRYIEQPHQGIWTGRAGLCGMAVAGVIWLVLLVLSLTRGDQILLAASKAIPVTHEVHPQLFNVVEEMKIAAGLPAMPKIYIIADPAPNAFATGRDPKTASIAVTAGLLAKMNRDELQGVVAHEISHILHRDILYMTVAGVMLGSIVLLSEIFLRGLFYSSLGSNRRYSAGGRGGGQGKIVLLVIAIVAAILAPIMAYLLYFALSRRREYLADAGAARLTRYPEGLASALEKIANDPSPQLSVANKATAPMYIVNPFKKKASMRLSGLTSTHPPVSERIRILRSMAQGASFKDYARAYRKVTRRKSIVPPSALTEEQIQVRTPSAEPMKKQPQEEQIRQVGDIIRKVNQFIFLTCLCGLKLKIPPNFKQQTVICPRCKRTLHLQAK